MLGIKTVLPAMIAFTLVAIPSSGQVLPIKPGLWQVQREHDTSGQMSEVLKSMPPEARAQMEAAMKKPVKVCFTREMLDPSKFVNSLPDCKTTYSSRANGWKSHTTCPKDRMGIDSEMMIAGPESYTVKTTSTFQSEGETNTTHDTMTGKWLSADCGDTKPLSTKK